MKDFERIDRLEANMLKLYRRQSKLERAINDIQSTWLDSNHLMDQTMKVAKATLDSNSRLIKTLDEQITEQRPK